MKMTKLLVVTVATITLGASSAFAASPLIKACKSDLDKFGCKVKTDKQAHECLEKNEKEGVDNEGFSADCYTAHEKYEGHTGKGEKEEHEKH